MSTALSLDLRLDELRRIGAELGASDKQVFGAYARAVRRTAQTLRTMSARSLKDELQLRTISLLRKRLKSTMRITTGRYAEGAVWIGTNDMPASWFKGRPRKTAGGAEMRGQQFPGAFVAKSDFKGRRTVFKRAGAGRLPIREQNLDVESQAVRLIEDKVFSEVETIFWRVFRRELQARVTYNIGER